MDRAPPIAKRLKEARLRAGLSQRRLGIEAGMDEFVASARINQYERSKHVPAFATVELLAKALGCPTAYFYTRDEELAEVVLLTGRLSRDQQRRLLGKLRQGRYP